MPNRVFMEHIMLLPGVWYVCYNDRVCNVLVPPYLELTVLLRSKKVNPEWCFATLKVLCQVPTSLIVREHVVLEYIWRARA